VFDKFPKYHMKMLLGDFKPTTGKQNLHDINDNGARVVIFSTSKNMIVRSTRFSHCNILGHLTMEILTIKLIIF
jgi:hypothetical protein